MRNFKKFLALVLAMLMVSACAVSVSAFDDVKDGDKYAEAIEMLADLGVIQGPGDGKFYPDKTLTREEAAVVAAKVLVGAQPVEWNEATTRFTDVVDEWSFAYINYVDEEGVMVGQGGDIFNPKAKLRIDEALKIAVVIADPAAARRADLEYAKNPSLGWAAYYINEADELGLTAGVALRKYDVACSRAMFAQFIYNAFDFVAEEDVTEENRGDKFGLQENFGYGEVEGEVTYAANTSIVTVAGKQIAGDLFNEALKEAGYTKTAADLDAENSKVYMSWMKSGKNIVILTMEVLTDCDVVKYNSTDIKIENVYDDLDGDGKFTDLNKGYIKIDDVKYVVNASDATEENKDVLGGADLVTVGITVKLNGDVQRELNTLPKYFEAFLYDDNDDGDYERCDIVEYAIATITKEAKSSSNGYKYDLYTVNFFNEDGTKESRKANNTAEKDAIFSVALENIVADSERPVLIQKVWREAAGATIDILEDSEVVKGQLTSLIPGSPASVVIDGTTYKYVNNTLAVPASTSLKQTITIYTINNELFTVTDASFVDKTIVLDKASVNADGNVVLTGFDATTFAAVEYELAGQLNVDSNKYVAVAGHYGNKDGDFETAVFLGGSKDSEGLWKEDTGIMFVEGTYYDIDVTADGNYYAATQQVANPDYIEGVSAPEIPATIDKTLANYFTAGTAISGKVSIDSSYIYVGGIATYYNKDTVVIIPQDYTGTNAYGVTYKMQTVFAEATDVVAYTDSTADNKVAVVYVEDAGSAKFDTLKNIGEGQTIVQALSNKYVAADFDYFTYEVVDLLANKKDTVKSATELVAGQFYLVKDGVVVENTTGNWVKTKRIDVINPGTGLIKEYFASPTAIVNKDADGNATYGTIEEKKYSKIMISAYADTDNNGIIDINASTGAPVTVDNVDTLLTKVDSTKSVNSANYVTAFAVEDKIIIIG